LERSSRDIKYGKPPSESDPEIGDAKGCGVSFHPFSFSLSFFFFCFGFAVQLPREQIADYREFATFSSAS